MAIFCPNSDCGIELDDSFSFCHHCGSPVRKQCHVCGKVLAYDANICSSCGASLVHKCSSCNKSFPLDYKVCPYCSEPLEKKCNSCGTVLPPAFRAFKVCPYCAEPLEKKCSSCGRKMEKDFILCPYCGDSLGKASVNVEEEARRKAEEEARRKAEEEARRKAEEEARRKAEEEARRKAEEEARRKAEEEARRKAEEEARRKAEEEARRKAEEEARRKAEEEARRKAEEEARRKAEEEARRKAEEEARRKAEEEARRKAEEEARRKAEEEARRKAEEEARRKAEEEARRKAEEEARRKAEEEARRKAEEEARRKAEEEAGLFDSLSSVSVNIFSDLASEELFDLQADLKEDASDEGVSDLIGDIEIDDGFDLDNSSTVVSEELSLDDDFSLMNEDESELNNEDLPKASDLFAIDSDENINKSIYGVDFGSASEIINISGSEAATDGQLRAEPNIFAQFAEEDELIDNAEHVEILQESNVFVQFIDDSEEDEESIDLTTETNVFAQFIDDDDEQPEDSSSGKLAAEPNVFAQFIDEDDENDESSSSVDNSVSKSDEEKSPEPSVSALSYLGVIDNEFSLDEEFTLDNEINDLTSVPSAFAGGGDGHCSDKIKDDKHDADDNKKQELVKKPAFTKKPEPPHEDEEPWKPEFVKKNEFKKKPDPVKHDDSDESRKPEFIKKTALQKKAQFSKKTDAEPKNIQTQKPSVSELKKDSAANSKAVVSPASATAVKPAFKKPDDAKPSIKRTVHDNKPKDKHAEAAVGNNRRTPSVKSLLEIGDVLEFGRYAYEDNGVERPVKWKILDIKDGKYLLFSQIAIFGMKFNDDYSDITWSESDLRQWLNTEFYESAFTENEKNQLSFVNTRAETSVCCPVVIPGGVIDKVFCLSKSEAMKYFCDNSLRKRKATPYAQAQGAYANDFGYCYYWLRSQSIDLRNAMYVNDSGGIDSEGFSVTSAFSAVCPAIWVDMSK